MEQKPLYSLSTDRAFSTLIHPLSKEERLQLEENILRDGCIDPIIVWNNVIIDGHNRYSICQKHQIPFEVRHMNFSCRHEAIAWICANQLGRRNISVETRRYLIGKQYEAEIIARRVVSKAGNNQYQTKYVEPGTEKPEDRSQKDYKMRSTGQKIAKQNNISRRTADRCIAFSKAIDLLETNNPKLAKEIMSGERKIPLEKISEIAKAEALHSQVPDSSPGRREPDSRKNPIPKPSIKDMPIYDPDGEATTLSLTVPSWKESINRVVSVIDMEKVSPGAKEQMHKVLCDLIASAQKLIAVIQGSERLN